MRYALGGIIVALVLCFGHTPRRMFLCSAESYFDNITKQRPPNICGRRSLGVLLHVPIENSRACRTCQGHPKQFFNVLGISARIRKEKSL